LKPGLHAQVLKLALFFSLFNNHRDNLNIKLNILN
jgi:hypothetical protein